MRFFTVFTKVKIVIQLLNNFFSFEIKLLSLLIWGYGKGNHVNSNNLFILVLAMIGEKYGPNSRICIPRLSLRHSSYLMVYIIMTHPLLLLYCLNMASNHHVLLILILSYFCSLVKDLHIHIIVAMGVCPSLIIWILLLFRPQVRSDFVLQHLLSPSIIIYT